jgi:putative ABC transport system permease protein
VGRAGREHRRRPAADLERYAGKRQVFVLTSDESQGLHPGITDQWFGLMNVQVAVAVLVAILGIVNTLTVSITDRRRELGVLQAVGALRGQVRRTIWIEALAIGRSGSCWGAALGAVNLTTCSRSCSATSRAAARLPVSP